VRTIGFLFSVDMGDHWERVLRVVRLNRGILSLLVHIGKGAIIGYREGVNRL